MVPVLHSVNAVKLHLFLKQEDIDVTIVLMSEKSDKTISRL